MNLYSTSCPHAPYPAPHASNLVLYDYVDKRLGELERNLRDEIRKTREELLANDEKIKQELLQKMVVKGAESLAIPWRVRTTGSVWQSFFIFSVRRLLIIALKFYL